MNILLENCRLSGDRCRCMSCFQDFNSTKAFDRHRTGVATLTAPGYGRRCRQPYEMLAAGMRLNEARFWVLGPPETSHQDRRQPVFQTRSTAGRYEGSGSGSNASAVSQP